MSAMIQEGDQAPKFTITTDTGSFSMADAKGPVVVFFFPKADTPGCTKEAIAFSQLKSEFDALNTTVIGISKDKAAKQGKFREKHDLTCALGADDESDICEQFGVWAEKSMYGRTYMGVLRATFLIDAAGKVARVWPKVKVPGHAEEVLDAVKSL
jgi:peroxiredoxin Q/BCP